MKFLRFMFTARRSFLLFALLAFALTVLYLGWVKHQQATELIRQVRPARTR